MNLVYAAIAAVLMISNPGPTVSQETDELRRNMKALELFLQDKNDHQKYCPGLRWSQPDIKVYKRTLASHLPPECKR